MRVAPDGPRDVPHLVRRLYHSVTGPVGRITCFPSTRPDLRLPIRTRSRLWDVADFRKQKAVLVAKAAQPGQRMSVSSAGFSRDGKLVVGGACVPLARAPVVESVRLTHTRALRLPFFQACTTAASSCGRPPDRTTAHRTYVSVDSAGDGRES